MSENSEERMQLIQDIQRLKRTISGKQIELDTIRRSKSSHIYNERLRRKEEIHKMKEIRERELRSKAMMLKESKPSVSRSLYSGRRNPHVSLYREQYSYVPDLTKYRAFRQPIFTKQNPKINPKLILN